MAEVQVVERKLAAIFAADVAEYSRLMGLDEVGTLRRLQAYRAILDPLISAHRGRIFNTASDSVVAGNCLQNVNKQIVQMFLKGDVTH